MRPLYIQLLQSEPIFPFPGPEGYPLRHVEWQLEGPRRAWSWYTLIPPPLDILDRV
jgi:hypothetical protein